MVFEHPGESTFPVSTLVVKKGGIVVICAGTTGFKPEAWCPDCGFYKLRRTPKKRERRELEY